ncbi:HlyD family type I secretion periplasmic adaptor subunit [Endothiovibrio diazotrophicus]
MSALAGLRHHLRVFAEVWRNRERLGPADGRPRGETDFLPAALEIQQTPPAPAGRAILWTVILFFLCALAWATFGKVDIIAVAGGKIIPGERVKVIQPLEIGTIGAIRVEEGQAVRAGDTLIELDATASEADRKRLEQELAAARLEAARLRAMLEGIERGSTPQIEAVPGVQDEARIAVQNALLQRRLEEFRAKVGELESAREKGEAEIAAMEADVARIEATLPLITKRATALKALAGKRMAAEQQYLELEEQRIDRRQELVVLRSRLKESRAAIAESGHRLDGYRAQFRSDLLSRRAEAERKVAGLREEYAKARLRAGQQTLVAPVDGVVQQLAVHTVGGVVTPAQELMRIVPRDAALEVEAWVANRDIGFVREGQRAEVKVDAFPFTKYGMLDAELVKLSDDAVADEQRGLVYAARVALARTVMDVEGKRVNLSPGMTVTVEVKTGRRRLIEFFLAPLLRYRQESIRER